MKSTAETAIPEKEVASLSYEEEAEVSPSTSVETVEGSGEKEAIDKPLEVKTINGKDLTATENLDSPVIGKFAHWHDGHC